MNKEEIYAFLKKNNVWFDITEHKAVYNMEEMKEIPLPYPEADAKNLFVRDDKKKNYYLIVVKGEKRVDLKSFREREGTRSLSFASEAELTQRLCLTPGSVTPLGILNGKADDVTLFIDSELSDGLIGVHPNDNTATLWLRTSDLVKIIEKCGVNVRFTEI